MTKRTLTKAGRLVLLFMLRQDGVLDTLSLQAIGDVLGVNRSTILRDLRELDEVAQVYRRLIATQPWVQREYGTTEVAEVLGVSADTVRAMIHDGLIVAVKRDEQWRVSFAELQRWREIVG